MTDPKDLPPDFTDLRRRAEGQIEAEAISPEELSPDQAARLIHKLRVHQIELEMQNEELRRSQAELEESRVQYADLYDFAPVGYFTLDPLGKIVEANLTTCTLLGKERSKLLDFYFPSFLAEEDRLVFRRALELGQERQEQRGEFRFQSNGGNERVMLLNIFFLRDAQGQDRYRVTMTDITELKRTQEELRKHHEELEELVAHRTSQLIEANKELRQANEQLEALFAAAPIAIAEFDAEGRVSKINLAAELLFGWTREEVQGRLPLSIPKESPEESLALLQQVLGGKAITGVEIKQQCKDGRILDASVSGAPLYDAQGKIRGFIGLAEDITEHKKLEETLRTQALVLASMAEGVAVSDQRGQIIYTNPAFDAMFGYKTGELVGRHSNILNQNTPEENVSLVKDILTSIRTTGLWTGEFRNCRKTGSPFFTSARISALKIDGKKLYISVQEDITQQKKTRQMLERQADLLDLAHDAILVRDTRGHITYWNLGAVNHYGYSKEAALGQISHSLLKTLFPQPLMEIERALLEQGFWEGEITHTTRQGKKLVMNSRWTANRDEAGRVTAILEMNQDVTAQKQIEAEVHRMASFPLLNPNPVVEVDEDGEVTYANPAARRLAEKIRFKGGAKAFLPPDLKEKFATVRQGGPRQYRYELSFDDTFFTAVLSFPHDLPTARIYAMDISERQRAERARRESEERYRSLVELSPDGIMVHAQGRYVFANPAGLELFGAACPEDLMGRRVLELVHPDSQITVRQRLKAGERLDIREVKILRLDGRAVEVEVAATLITYGGQPAVQVVLRDITARKAAEAALARKQAEFAAIFNSMTDAVVFTDTQRRIAMVNPAAEALFGYEASEFYGRTTEFLYVSREDYEELGRQRYHARLGRPLPPYEISYRRKDGSVFPAETRGGQVRDAQGRVIGLVGIHQDITERKAAEEALRESERRFRQVVETLPQLVWTTQADGACDFLSKQWLEFTGQSEAEQLGYRWLYQIHPDDQAGLIQAWQRSVASGSEFAAEFRLRRQDGIYQWFDSRAVPLRDEQGTIVKWFGANTDIQTQRELRESLMQAKEAWERTFNAVPDFISILDKEHRVLRMNKAMCDLLHKDSEMVIGLPCYQAVHGMEVLPDFCPHAKMLVSGQAHYAEVHEFDRIFAVSVSPIFGPDGELSGGVHVARDITESKRAEEALRESEERYRSIFENSHAAMLLIDPETGAIVGANPAASAYYGYSREEFLDHRITDFNTLAPELVEEEMQQARLEARRHFEFKHRLADGAIRDVEVFSGPIRIKGRELLYSIVHDITARKEAEEALRQSNQRLDLLAETAGRLLAEGSPQEVVDALCHKVMDFLDCDLFFNYLVDTPGKRLHLNAFAGMPAATGQELEWLDYGVAVCGYAAQEARRIVCEDIQTTPDPHTELLKDAGVRAYACHPLMVGTRLLGTLAFGTRRKNSFTADDLALMKAVADQVAIAMERKQAEEALRESESRYRAVGELIPFGSWTAAPDGGWKYVSKSFLKMADKTLEECQGFGWMNLLPQEDIKPTLKAWQNCLETRCFWDHEFKVQGREGHYRTVLSRGLPLADSQGSITSWVGINLDISERKEMEEALRRARDELEVRVEERTAALRQVNEQLIQEIQERQEVEDRLRDSEARFTAFMEHLPGLAVMRDMEGRYLFANRAWEENMNLQPGQWLGKTLAEIWPPERTAALQKSDFDIISTGKPTEEVEVQVLADGPHHFLTSRFPITDEDGLAYMVGAVAIDVTDRQRAEQQVAETGRLYRVLSQVNEAIMRGRDQQALFDQVCRIVVEEGLFTMAWVGLTDPEDQTVRVAAKYGFDEGYLDNLKIPLADVPEGRGPTGTAVREDRYDVCNDFNRDPRMAPWRQQALKQGYQSSGAFPLRIGAEVVGAIALYAPRPEFFTDKEIALLTSLADNLSFALEFLDREAKRRQAEEALATERQRSLDLLENLPAFVYLQAPDYSIRFANREFRERFGEPRGDTCYTLIWGKKKPCTDCPTFSVFRTGQPREWEWTGPDSQIYQVYDYPFADVDGSPLVLEMGIDITQRKRAEEALAEQATLVQDLYNNAPCGYHSLDSDGYIVQINDTELTWLGYNRDEVIGKLTLTDLLTPESRKAFADNFPLFKGRGWVKDLEYELVRKDGTTFPVLLNATSVTDEAGNYLMSRSTIFDVTDRKQAEKALARSEAMLRLILDNLPVGVWVTDREGRIIEGNPAARRIWGGARYVSMEEYGEYQGWWADTGKKIEPAEWALARAIQKGETSVGEVINIQSFDGSHKTIINSGVPLFGENQEILGAIVVNQDITEIVRAEQVIREQGRQLEAFFAHSITPLVFLDRDFNFLRVNEAYARAYQKNTQDFIDHNHFELYPHEENEAIFAKVVRSKISYQVQAKPFEFPDHPEWGVTYWDWSLVPILDQAGEVDFLVFSLRDVTRRVLTEQARNRLIEILEATPDFVGIADFYGHLQYLNRAGRAMVGVGEDEDISLLRVLELHPEEIGKQILEKGVPVAMKEGAWQAELVLLHRDGHEIPVSQVILAHKDIKGRVQFFSTVARDISDMKEAQASILRQTAILNGINRIFRDTLTCETVADLGQTCLSIAEGLTNSQFGFISEISQQNLLAPLALTEPDWQSCGLQPARDLSHTQSFAPSGLLARPLTEGKALFDNDPASFPGGTGIPADYPPLTAYLGVPLAYGGMTLGLLGLSNKQGGYTLIDQETVESLAPAIVEALMHHRAEEALKASESKLRYLADQLLTAQENERKRLAAELHDELGHALLALKLHLSSIERKLPPEQEKAKEEIRGQLDYIHEVIQDVRRLYHDLSPGDVEDLGLTKALGTLINDFAAHFPDITWKVDLANMEGLFSLPVQTTIYRILQEALTNIGKHANPNTVTISSIKENHQVRFTVQDDGTGFDVAQELGSRSSGRGVGLVAMEERLNMVGGTFEIQSRVNEGTRLSFTIPAIPEGERP